jgi:hypothetical protein
MLTRSKLRAGISASLIILASGMTGGCALSSLIEPYDWSPSTFDASRFTPPARQAANQDPRRNLSVAIQFADGVREAYRRAAGTQSGLATLPGLALIPMSAGATALGANNIEGGAITQLSIAGATLYATAGWLRSAPREHAYLLGAAGIHCITQAANPIVNVSNNDSDTLDRILGQSGSDTVPMESQIDDARAARDDVADTLRAIDAETKRLSETDTSTHLDTDGAAEIIAIKAGMSDANKAIDASVVALDRAKTLRESFGMTALRVVSSVELIEDGVNDIIRQTLPSLSDLPTYFDQIKASANLPKAPDVKGTTVPDLAKPPATNAKPESSGVVSQLFGEVKEAPRRDQHLRDLVEQLHVQVKTLNNALHKLTITDSDIRRMVDAVNNDSATSLAAVVRLIPRRSP